MPMTDFDAFSRTLEVIHDAAIDPALWPRALEGTCGFAGGAAARIAWQDAATDDAFTSHSWGANAHYDRLYAETYRDLNPYFPALAFVEPGLVVAGEDLIPHEEFRQSRFFREWVAPQG